MNTSSILKLTRQVVIPVLNYVGDDVDRIVNELSKLNIVPRRLKCIKCNEEIDISTYITHIADHIIKSSGKDYLCTLCNSKFKSKGLALRHLKEHFTLGIYRNGMWIWICGLCLREFTSKKSVLVHLFRYHEKTL